MEAPFYSPDLKLFKQVDGIAMGSPLGVSFHTHPHLKPKIYCRYVDDIFITYDNSETINELLQILNNSKLKFTMEKSNDNKLTFLDVLVQNLNDKFKTSVYIKPTNKELCINGNSECTAQLTHS